MLVLTAAEIQSLAPVTQAIESLQAAFGTGCFVPARQVAKLSGGEGERLLLVMPAFDAAGGGIVKLSTVFPDNSARALPTIQGAIVVFSETGAPIALLDGAAVTQLRTAAASALASIYLSRADSSHLLVIGTGALVLSMVLAHCAVRPITRVSIWGRRAERVAQAVFAARSIINPTVEVCGVSEIEAVVATADIVSCVTSATTPVLAGNWLSSGTFVDLVGSFSPSKREADDDVILRSRLFVDTIEGALTEAGDIIDPLVRGIISRERVEGELSDLVCARTRGRISRDEITLFKSVGTALEDLAAAKMIVEIARRKRAAVAV